MDCSLNSAESRGILMTMIMQEANDVRDSKRESYECDDKGRNVEEGGYPCYKKPH